MVKSSLEKNKVRKRGQRSSGLLFKSGGDVWYFVILLRPSHRESAEYSPKERTVTAGHSSQAIHVPEKLAKLHLTIPNRHRQANSRDPVI